MSFSQKSISFLLISALFFLALSQDGITITTEELSDNIYLFRDNKGLSNTVVYTYDSGAVIIDTKVGAYLNDLNQSISMVTDNPITYVVNTHCHFDHVDGNIYYGERGAQVIAHENARLRMTDFQNQPLLQVNYPPVPAEGLPTITFDKKMTLHLGDETLELLHFGNGHTDGDAVIYFKDANVIHLGDLYFTILYPYIGVHTGGSINYILKSLRKISLVIDDETKIVGGHGTVKNKADLKEYIRMLATVRRRINRMIRQDMTLEEVIDNTPTADFDEVWGNILPPEFFVTVVYTDLVRFKKTACPYAE